MPGSACLATWDSATCVFGLGAGIFFISYVALQIPGALLVERWSARRMISATMIAWGFLTSLTALVHTPAQLYLARFALGAAEAGFFPGVVVYLSHWFIREDRCKSTSNFMAAIPLSFIIGSPLAGWILGHAWFHIQGWRWLFVLEGLPAIVFGVVAFFFLTDWPREAHWLVAEQREWIVQKLEEEKPPGTSSSQLRASASFADGSGARGADLSAILFRLRRSSSGCRLYSNASPGFPTRGSD